MIWLIQSVLAAQLSTSYVDCPFGEPKIPGSRNIAKVYTKIADNSTGGFDSDFATYASEGQWRQYQIATCDDNLFTVYGADVAMLIPADKRAAVAAALKTSVAALPDPAKPQVWERYGIAAAIYGALGKDQRFLGDLWLSASWTARDAAVGYYANLTGPVTARKLIQAGWEELRKDLSVGDRKKVLYNLARVAQRSGFSAERDGFVAGLEALGIQAGGLEPDERANLDRFKRMTTVVEPGLQRRVIAAYAAALKEIALRPEEIDRLIYTTADLHRRLGEMDAAEEGYRKILNGDASDELQGMAQFLLAEMGRKGKPR